MRFIALGLLFFICGLSITFFLFVIASPLSSLKAEETALNQSLSSSKDKIIKQTLLSTRLTDIESITTKRSHYDSVLKTFMDTLPAGTTMGEFTAEKKIVEVAISTSSLDDVESCFTKLKLLVANKDTFSQVFMSSLGMSVDSVGNVTGFNTRLIILLL